MVRPLITTKPVSPFATKAAQTSIVSGVVFAVLLLSLHVLEPEYDPTWRFISEYALGRFGWVIHLAFLAMATSLLTCAICLASQTRTVPGHIGIAIVIIGALGFLIAAIFRTDAVTTARAAATFTGTMHVIGASLDFSPVGFLLISFSLRRNQAWRSISKWLFIAAAITLVLTAAFMAVLPYDGKVGPGGLAGLFGRFMLLSYLGWLLVAGFQALRLSKRELVPVGG